MYLLGNFVPNYLNMNTLGSNWGPKETTFFSESLSQFKMMIFLKKITIKLICHYLVLMSIDYQKCPYMIHIRSRCRLHTQYKVASLQKNLLSIEPINLKQPTNPHVVGWPLFQWWSQYLFGV